MKTLLGAAAIGALSFAASPASAFEITDYMFNNTLWNDESGESQVVDVNGNHLLDVGDTLRGILHINQANNQDNGGSVIPAVNNNEITMIFEAQVTSKTATVVDPIRGQLYNFSFGAVGGLNGTGFVAPGVSNVAGAMVAVYFDHDENTNKFQLNGTCTTTGSGGNCEANASDDSLALVLGQGDDVDFLWAALNASDNPQSARMFSTTTELGSFITYLQILVNNTGREFNEVPESILFDQPGGDGKIDVTAGGTLRGSCSVDTFPNPCANPATPYDAEDKTQFHFSVVPEPASLTILGASLLGLGFASRRRRK